jgi:hypothetical protein
MRVSGQWPEPIFLAIHVALEIDPTNPSFVFSRAGALPTPPGAFDFGMGKTTGRALDGDMRCSVPLSSTPDQHDEAHKQSDPTVLD